MSATTFQTLRRTGICVRCHRVLSTGAAVVQADGGRSVLCADCGVPHSRGVPGSALRGKFGHNGARGVGGEEALGGILDSTSPGCFEVVHSLLRPRSAGDIDHVVVAASGIWIIDTKCWQKPLGMRCLAGVPRVCVESRDRTDDLVATMIRQQEAVRKMLDAVGCARSVPIHSAVCFVHGRFDPSFRECVIEGVHFTWPAALLGHLESDGPLRSGDREEIADALAKWCSTA